MAALPTESQPSTVAEIYRGYERENREQHRLHLGASLIGRSCAREIWYTFRWADREHFDGRMLRLFASGHLQEPRLIADLRRIPGVTVAEKDPSTDKQWSFTAHGGHFGCSLDGAAVGLPEAPKTWHSLEFKGVNQKTFDKIVKEGVAKAKPEHHAQMIVGMELAGLERCLYLVVNKNTDEIYGERVKADSKEAKRLLDRGLSIIQAKEPPARISERFDWHECKFCRFHSICHGERAPEVNCRTCAHSAANVHGAPRTGDKGGEWVCGHDMLKSMPVLGESLQRTGCSEHRYIPILLEKSCKPIDYVDGVVVYQTNDGEVFGNGDGKNGTFASQEIRNATSPRALPPLAPVKADFPAAKVIPTEVAA